MAGAFSRASGLARRGATLRSGATARRRAREPRQRLVRYRTVRCSLQCAPSGARPLRGRPRCRPATRSAALRFGGLPFRGDSHSGAPRLRQSDRDRLLRRCRPVFSFADMVDLFTHEFAGLRRGRFSLRSIATRSLQCFLLRHGSPDAMSDVDNCICSATHGASARILAPASTHSTTVSLRTQATNASATTASRHRRTRTKKRRAE